MTLPRAFFGSRYLAVVLSLSIGTLASVCAFLLVLSWEHRVAEIDFQSRAKGYLQIIDADLSDANTLLYTLGAYVETDDHTVSRQQFGRFAHVLHDRVLALRSTGWAPRVSRAGRAAFERTVLVPLGIARHARILERNARGAFVTAAERPAYYPILYIETDRKNRRTELARVLAFDLTSERLRAAAIARTLRSHEPAATPPLRMITVKGQIGGVMGFMAVRSAGSHGRSERPSGVVLGSFDIGPMVESIIAKKMPDSGLDLYLFNPAGPFGHRLIYWHSSSRAQRVPAERDVLSSTHWQSSVTMIDQHWGAIVTPAPATTRGSRLWYAVVTFAVGMTMTAMIVAYVLISQRRAKHLEGVTATLRRTTDELHRNVEQIAHMARRDTLTGLANRLLFHERIDEAIAGRGCGVPFALFYLDLDCFKAVNDSLGHGAGDRLLALAAERITHCLREIDTIARLGGDEFAIILAGAGDMALIAAVAERLIGEVGKPYIIDGCTAMVGVSVGIAVTTSGDDTTPDELIKQADRALYEAKSAGRGTFRLHRASLPLPAPGV